MTVQGPVKKQQPDGMSHRGTTTSPGPDPGPPEPQSDLPPFVAKQWSGLNSVGISEGHAALPFVRRRIHIASGSDTSDFHRRLQKKGQQRDHDHQPLQVPFVMVRMCIRASDTSQPDRSFFFSGIPGAAHTSGDHMVADGVISSRNLSVLGPTHGTLQCWGLLGVAVVSGCCRLFVGSSGDTEWCCGLLRVCRVWRASNCHTIAGLLSSHLRGATG